MIRINHKYSAVAKLRMPGDWIVASRVKKKNNFVEDAVALLDNPTEGLRLRWLSGDEYPVTYEGGLDCFWQETLGDDWIDTHFVNTSHRGSKQ